MKKAGDAKVKTEIAEEKEAIEIAMLLQEGKNKNKNKSIGKPLYSQSRENSTIWDVIVLDDSNKTTYGTRWNYISKNTEIKDYGSTKYNWVFNDDTGEVIFLEDTKFKEYNHKMNLAVNDETLIFNMDSSNMTSNISTWGDNITLYYYDDETYNTIEKRTEAYEIEKEYTSVTEFSGYDRQVSSNINEYYENNAFKFGGNNYIEIYDTNGFDFTKGLTFEFYGKINDGTFSTSNNNIVGLLGLWTGEYKIMCPTRFWYKKNSQEIGYGLIYGRSPDIQTGIWSGTPSYWNQFHTIDNLMNNDNYLTIVFEPESESSVIQRIYLNGSLLDEGWFNPEGYKKFNELCGNYKYIQLGRVNYDYESNWCYAKGICYTSRIYNRALTDEEVLDNYTTTTTYRSLINSNN